MTIKESSSDSGSAGAGSVEKAENPASKINPNLSANLLADYEALQNDLGQANELAADFQRQLAGKSNEFAQLKQVFEKTQGDLAKLQAGIVELRSERHHLANEAMRATAFELKMRKVTGERDKLRVDLEVVREALTRSMDEMARLTRERDSHLNDLIKAVGDRDRLRSELAALRENNVGTSREDFPEALRERDAQIAALVIELVVLKDDFAELRRASGENGVPEVSDNRKPVSTPDSSTAGAAEDFIDISFSA